MRLIGNWMPLVNDNQDRAAAGLAWWQTNGTGSKTQEFGFGSAHPSVVNALSRGRVRAGVRLSAGNCGNAGWSDTSCVLYRLGHRSDGGTFNADLTRRAGASDRS